MKKRSLIFSAVLAAVLLISFTGCSVAGTGESAAGNGTKSGVTSGSVGVGTGNAYNPVSLPEQYSITYEIESAEGIVRTVQKTKDADGNVYFRSDEEELLFLIDGDNYTLYRAVN